jgi:tRNA(Ile)-lysidine synthase
MYYGTVQKLVQSVLAYIRRHQLLQAGDRVGVAVSGGVDSVALLRLLLELRKELGVVLSVVHFNHKLRGAEADADEQFVVELARRHKLELQSESDDVAACAAAKHLGVEAAAREMRYKYFVRLLLQAGFNCIATAHTLDDQAETVLLRIVRGAGTRGLAGIYPRLPVAGSQFSEDRWGSGLQTSGNGLGNDLSAVSIVRPLLNARRRDLEAYLAGLGQGWREDSSNRDLRHARNRVRHGILPRLERNLNPAVREALAETAEIARAEEEFWASEVARVLPQIWEARVGRRGSGANVGGMLNIALLMDLPLALRRRVVRTAAESLGLRLEFRHVEEILKVASGEPGSSKSAVLPNDWVVSRNRNKLRFGPADAARDTTNFGYEYRLPVPGRLEVPEAGTLFEVVPVLGRVGPGYNPEHLFDPALLARELRVRNWRAGDRFWPAHTKSPKKIKELLRERHVTGRERKLWPVVVSGDDVVWVRGFLAPAQLRPRDEAKAVVIRELPLPA